MTEATHALDPDEALSHLQTSRELTRLARDMALKAQAGLSGARHVRAVELADKLADAQAHADRLEFVVRGDLRADQALEAAVSRHPAGRAK